MPIFCNSTAALLLLRSVISIVSFHALLQFPDFAPSGFQQPVWRNPSSERPLFRDLAVVVGKVGWQTPGGSSIVIRASMIRIIVSERSQSWGAELQAAKGSSCGAPAKCQSNQGIATVLIVKIGILDRAWLPARSSRR